MASKIDEVARALDAWTENALDTHGRFDTREMARAAIEAMREPTEAMVEAAHTRLADEGDVADVYRAMLNAAIAEGRTG